MAAGSRQQELTALQAEEKTEKEKAEVRVSLTEPEARKMKHGDNAIAPSYNAQISTEADNKIIVGAHLSQCSSDSQAMPAVEQMEQNLGQKPEQVVVDGGYTNRGSMEAMAEQHIDLIGSMADPAERSAAAMKASGIDPAFAPQFFVWDQASNTLRCPAEKLLDYKEQSRKNGNVYRQYQALGSDCAACAFRSQCCPKSSNGRIVSRLEIENEVVAAMRRKMETSRSEASLPAAGGSGGVSQRLDQG